MVFIRSLLFAFTLATLVGTSPAIGIAAEKSSPTTGAAAHATIGIDNFGRINETYYRGSQPDGRDYTDLAALGVKTVIDRPYLLLASKR